MDIKCFDIDYINNAEMIHYFGLGFIQVKLNKFERLHYYSNHLPKTSNEEEIHNHRYNFQSHILKGKLINQIYDIIEGDDYILSNETCNPNIKSNLPDKLVGINHFSTNLYINGNSEIEKGALISYYMHHDTFHKVETNGNTITYLKRGDYKKETAQVIRPINNELVCPFSKNMSKDELIDYIKDIING